MNDRTIRWGLNIKASREAKHLSQAQFADQVGKQQSTVSRWEAGIIVPRDDERQDIARVLGTTAEKLFAYEARPKAKAS